MTGFLVYLWSGGVSRRLTAQKWAERSWSVVGSDEEARVITRFPLKPGELDVPLDLLVHAYPFPTPPQEEPPCPNDSPLPPSPPTPSTTDSGSSATPDPEKPTAPASASSSSSPIDGELLSPIPSASGGDFASRPRVEPLDITP